jgi:hypothetical protein
VHVLPDRMIFYFFLVVVPSDISEVSAIIIREHNAKGESGSFV